MNDAAKKPGKSDRTRAAILEAARELFATEGYERTTVRDIAAKAAIDPALVIRYFGSKEALFVRAADIELRMPDLAAAPGSRGEAIVRHFLSIWEGEGGNPGMTILLRSAASNPIAAEKLRDVFAQTGAAGARARGGRSGAGRTGQQPAPRARALPLRLRAAAGRCDAGRADRARGRRDGAAISRRRVVRADPGHGRARQKPVSRAFERLVTPFRGSEMPEPAEIEAISLELMSLRGTGRQIEPFSKRYARFGLPEAYGVVARTRDLRIERGEIPVGRKIGFTNAAIWQARGISAPIWNYVFDRTVAAIGQAGAVVDLSGMPEPRIEPEVVLHLSASPQPGMTTRELLACLDWVAPGFEVVSSVFPAWEFSAADAAAAFGVHGALYVGEHLEVASAGSTLLDDLIALNVVLASDGGLRREGAGRDVLGGPIHALRFLVEELARAPASDALHAGELVTTGTLTEAMPLLSGQTWSAAFEGIDFRTSRLTAL